MKVTKKLLSVLLAITMIMSSMSVCFGVLAAPASSSTYDEDPIEYLSKALKSDTITWISEKYNYTYSGTAGNKNAITVTTNVDLPTYEQYCEVRDILIYLDMAIKGTTEWKKAETTNKDTSTRACTSASFVEAELLGALGNVSDAAKEFISFVLEDSRATTHAGSQGSLFSSGEKKVPASHTATLNIYTTDIVGYLNEVGEYTNVESSVELGYTYKIVMERGYYEDGLAKTKKWHNYIKGLNFGGTSSAAPSEMAGKANTSIKGTVNKYVTDVDKLIADNTFDSLAGMTLAQIEAKVAELKALRTSIKSTVDSDSVKNYDALFPGVDAKISAFEESAEKAKQIAAYSETVAEITAYQTNNPNYGVFNWGGFDEATIKADYKAFMDKYGSIINDATLYEYFTKNGKISDNYVKNFRDNTIAYDLEDLKEEKLIPLYDKYALSFPMEGGEELDLSEKVAAYSTLTGYINNIYSYREQVINAIFPETLNGYLDLQEKLECQVSDCVVYFAEHVGVDYSDVATADVIAEIETAKSQLAALNNLKNSVDYSDNLTLLEEPFENADEFIAYLYSLLGERFTAQVNAADDVYNSIGRPSSSLTIDQYSKLNVLIKAIEPDIVTYLDGEGQGALITQETRNDYAALQAELMPAFNAFEIDRGYTSYTAQDIIIRREDNIKEFFRENENLDDDLLGEYEVTDANVEKIISVLDAALKDPTIADLLGKLINKDEDGNPTGKAFDLAGLIRNLLNESVFTDELLNTIIQFVYPLVLKEFAKVWAGLPPSITIKQLDTGFMGIKADVVAGLALDDVETAIGKVGLYIGPKALASNLSSKFSKYSQVISKLNQVTIKAQYNLEKDTFRNPWEDEVLFKQATDKTTNELLFNDDGTPKMVYNLDWGINSAENKRAAFLDAAVAALSGLEPLLLALLTNKTFANANESDSAPRGVQVGTGGGTADVGISINLKVNPITLVLTFSANDGWDNALVPIFEALGLENIPHSEDLQSTRKLLENGLLAVIDQLISKLDTAPVTFLLNALPNLAYMLEAGMIEPLLKEIKTVINYYADASYDASVTSGTLKYAMGTCIKDGDNVVGWDGININIGEMINLKDMGLDISNFAAIWNMIAGGVELLAGLDAPDAALIATLGELIPKKTNRSVRTYTANKSGNKTLAADEAWYIQADKAAVLEYLLQWLLGSGLLGGIVENPNELVAGIFANLENNTNDVIAALVELLTQETVYNAKNYSWFNGTIYGENVLGNSANAIYMNPGNDWTKDKAQYLYNNIDSLVASILATAGLDLDDSTEEIDGSVDKVIADAIDGLLSDKTLTSLAALLAKLDINALLAPKAEEGEDATPETPETVAEGEEGEEGEAAASNAIDVNNLIKELLGIDLSVYTAADSKYAKIAAAREADDEYVDNSFGVDAAEKKGEAFAAALTEMLAPLSVVLDFILEGGNLEISLGNKKVVLLGSNGYNNAIIPLLEALGCDVKALGEDDNALEVVINTLVAKINSITNGSAIKNIIDLLPGVLYFIASNGLSTTVLNLLQSVLVIVDTIRPVIDVMDIINGIEVGKEGAKQTLSELLGGPINLKNLDVNFVFDNILPLLIDLDLSGLKNVIYDACNSLGKEYKSLSACANTVEVAGVTEGETVMMAKKGTYNANFDQADMLTVILSFVLEWATIKDNADKLDELLKTNGIIAALGDVFESVDINYGTPKWFYWFADEAAFNEYLAGDTNIPNTLYALEYPNDWNKQTADEIAQKLPSLVDMIIGLINKDKEDAPATLKDLLGKLIAENINADTLNNLVGMIADLLGDIDTNLLNIAGYILTDSETDKVDIVGLMDYECTAEIKTLSDFINELAVVLDTYASGLVDWLFFGDDFRFAKKSDKTDTIVINGGLGYEKGLAMILEALGCELPATVNTKTVLGALADRVDAILAAPVDEVLGLLPNLIYFLNANGAGVAIGNILAPVNALLDKLSAFGLNVSLADLIKFKVKETDEEGNEVEKEVVLNLEELSLANVVELLKKLLPEFDFSVVEEYLVNFCTGKITEGKYIYKMNAEKGDVVTIILTVALIFVQNEKNAAVLDEKLNTNIISALKEVFKSTPVEYLYPDYDYCFAEDGIDYDNHTVDVIKSAITYPNDWTEEKSEYLAKHLTVLVDMVVGMVSDYDSLAALLKDKVNIFTTETLEKLIGLIADLLGNVDDQLLELGVILNVDIVGLKNHKVTPGITTVEQFAMELATILNKYAKGVVEWLLLGDDIKLGVNDVDAKGTKLEGTDIITINGAHGYAEGLALILEALGCQNLPEVYDVEYKTEEVVTAVLKSLAARINEILEMPVDRALDLLPNLIYFLNANGVSAAVNNLAGAFNGLANKLKAFGLNISLNDLVDLKKILKTNVDVSLDNLTMETIIAVASDLTGLDLSKLSDVLVGFALGEVNFYDSVSRYEATARMEYKDEFDKHDMITVLVTAVLLVAFETDGNAEKLGEMLDTNIIEAIKSVFEDIKIEYTAPEWNYPLADNGTVDAMKYSITYPNNWNESVAQYVVDILPELGDMIAGMIDKNYEGVENALSLLLKDKVNVFTTANLQSIVDLLANLLKDIDDGLLKAAGVALGVDVVGLKTYKVRDGITTVEEFALELANILNTYAKGVVEWLLLGKDYRFFVKDVEDGVPVDFIVINGAYGYSEGLALLLEALGCQALPVITEETTTEEIVVAVLKSLAARINEIFEAPVERVIDLLPNLLYFLNANGVSAVVNNTLSALTVLLDKLSVFGINVDIKQLVNLKKLMKIEDTDASISLDNLTIASLLEAVSYMVDGLDLTLVEDVLVGFALGEIKEYESATKFCGPAKKMTYASEFEKKDMLTVLVNLVVLTIADEANADFVKGLVGEDIYKVIENLCVNGVVPADMLEMEWQFTDKADTGEVFSALDTSKLFEGHAYGPLYTEEMAQYIADNVGEFIDNVIYLLGIQINGKNVNSLKDLINGLLNGSLYNSTNVIAIRDALAGILDKVAGLEVNGTNVGKYIAKVLEKAEIADIEAVAKVEVPEFTENRDMFVEYLCDVIEPLYPVLNWILTDKDIAFFVDLEKKDAIKLEGAEGYVYGIIPLLEALDCKDVLTKSEYYDAVEADGDVVLTSILNPLLNRIDEILADDPAQEILDMLPNLIYFINSKGVNTVVKNTLNAVDALLSAIKPVAKIDIYELIGLDLEDLTFEKLFEMLLDLIGDATGYYFDYLDASAVAELTVGTLESYTSANELTAYKMVYSTEDAVIGNKAELVTVVLRLATCFILHENNQEMLIGILKDVFNMSPDAEGYISAILQIFEGYVISTKLGMDQALATLYYIYVGADITVDTSAGALKDVNAQWEKVLKDLGMSDDPQEQTVGNLIASILELDMFEDVLTPDGLAPNGLIKFFTKIIDWFKSIINFFKTIFA